MNLGYENKVVGITGAASPRGIGFAIVRQMLQEGAKVFLCDLRKEDVDAAVEQLSAYGTVKGYVADVSREEDIRALFDQAAADFGQIDVFINNAGIYPQVALMDMTADDWDKVMAINLRSVLLCAQNFYRYNKERGGVLLNASSYAALIGSAGSAAYAASKAAVHSLTKTLAAELAPYGIRVSGFVPGVIATGMTAGVVDSRGDQLLSQIAWHRLGTPEDVAKAVVFLGSDAADYMTGAFVEISGGKLCVQNPDYGFRS